MPLEDAIGLMGRSFEKYVDDLREKANKEKAAESSAATDAPLSGPSGAPSGSAMVPIPPPSADIKYLLNLLADNQPLTLDELDSVINYLQEKRDSASGGREKTKPKPKHPPHNGIVT